MLNVANINTLTAVENSIHGYIMENEDGIKVTIPKAEVPGNLKIGDVLDLFVYTGTDNIFLATPLHPKLKVNEFGFLKVKEVNDQGAFLDWGISKDLFVPFSEQAQKMDVGQHYLVYLFIDKINGRPLASSKTNKFIERDTLTVVEKDRVEILICEETDLGLKVIINNKHEGVIFHNEIFREIKIGERKTGYIKRIREDRKIDVALERTGFGRVDPSSRFILDKMKANNGFLALHDGSSPEEIKASLQMSKKTFKKAVGMLYKQRLVRLEKDGVYLAE